MTPPCTKKPQWFHPERHDHETAQAAVFVCQSCPMRAACLSEAVERGEVDGIWGGVCFNAETARSLSAKARQPRNPFMGPPAGSRVGAAVLRAAQTHCKRGHPFDTENTQLRPVKGGGVHRRCRKCKQLMDRPAAKRRYDLRKVAG